MLPLTSRPWRAVAYLLARLPLPAAGIGSALLLLAGRWELALVAVALFAAYVAAAVAAAPGDRRLVALLGRPVVGTTRTGSAAGRRRRAARRCTPSSRRRWPRWISSCSCSG